jgi:hypothetical protein
MFAARARTLRTEQCARPAFRFERSRSTPGFPGVLADLANLVEPTD